MTRLLAFAAALTLALSATARQDTKQATKKSPATKKDAPKVTGPAPTKEAVPYGPHPRQVLDFYQAKSDTPTPVVFAIHGGGWVNGSKDGYRGAAKRYNDAGLSLVAINYRMVPEAAEKGIDPPVKWPLEDAARALQFVRSKAAEWNLDKKRIGATGGSAGGCSSLYLLYHDDMADPKSADPVARESTRLFCAAVDGAQTTLDPKVLREWMPNYTYGGHAFAIVGPDGKRDAGFNTYLAKRDELLPKINTYSPMAHVTKDDPPVFLFYGNAKAATVKGESKEDPTHAPLLGAILMEKLTAEGVEGIFVHPGMPHPKYKSSADYLIYRLKAK
jgi:acetyl esterase/lipase